MQPTGAQIEQLQQALANAYDQAGLSHMTRIQLEADLEMLVPTYGKNRSEIAYALVLRYATQPGGLHQLLNAAVAGNPGNPALQALVQEFTGIDFDVLPLPAPIVRPFRPYTLPSASADFTGRENELAALWSALQTDQTTAVITGIRGMGGVGKTELALQAAHGLDLPEDTPKLFFELQPGGNALTPEQMANQVIQAFLPAEKLPSELHELLPLYRQVLGNQQGLLIFDNVTDADQVRPLLPPPAGWLVVVTSRRKLHLADARLFDLDVLAETDAIALLARLLHAGGRDDCVNSDDPAHAQLARLAELCGRLPLALRLAAGYLTGYADWSLVQYLNVLETARLNYLMLDGESVAATLGLSITRLRQDDLALAERWYALSVFPAPFGLGAVAAVWEADEGAAHAAISELVRYSLVNYDRDMNRYSLHDLLREVTPLTYPDVDAKVTEALQLRHAQYYLTRGGEVDDLYKEGGESIVPALMAFDVILPHLQAAWQRLQQLESDSARSWLSAFPDQTAYMLDLRQTPSEKIRLLQVAVKAACELGDRRSEGNHFGNLGIAYAHLGRVNEAINWYERALAISREIGHRRMEGQALGNLGLAYAALGRVEEAIDWTEQALIISREIGNRRGEGTRLGNLGLAYAALGRVEEAIDRTEQALAISREIGDRRGEGNHLGNLGLAYAALGRVEEAIDHHQQALAISREIGDRRGEGNHRGNLGLAYAALGRLEEVIDHHQQALAISREIGDRRGEGNHRGNLGLAYAALGRLEEAIDHHQQALAISREIGDRRGEGQALGNLGLAYADLGRMEEAIDHHQQALAISREIGDRRGESSICWNLGLVLETQGHPAEAAELMQVSVDFEREIGHPNAEPDALRLEDMRCKAGLTD